MGMALKSRHTFVFGPSDAGKSTYLREFQDKFPGHTIFVNHASGTGDYDGGFAGHRCATRQEIHKAVERSGRIDAPIDFRPPSSKPREAFSEAAMYAVDYADSVGSRTGTPVQIICDEFHQAMPDGDGDPSENPAAYLLHEGRDKGIKVVGATQRPPKLDYDPLAQAKYFCFVGNPSVFAEGFFRYFSGFDMDDMPDREYQISVLNRSGELMHERETDTKYADGK